MQRLLLIIGFLLLFTVEILRVYFIMPFPGSQQTNTISFAYWLSGNIVWLRILAFLLILFPVINIFKNGKKQARIILPSALLLYAIVFFFINFQAEADKMFYQPHQLVFAQPGTNKIKGDKLVIGVAINGEAKAYPIQFIGYHHQVRDSVGHTPVIVTYCTVCRTGRAFSPEVRGKVETFRLVGMDHFNAMFEDATTKSWWQQATGVAVAGPLRGTALQEIPSRQSTLAAWLQQYPNSFIMQPDTLFADEYKDMANYDKGNGKSSLTKRDSLSWRSKSWVVGVKYNGESKAFDWNELVKSRIIQDSLRNIPVLLTLESDTATFHVFDRRVKGKVLSFTKYNDEQIIDNTQSIWNMAGDCTNGILKGEKLQSLQAYQEFWHSWQTFHPETKKR
ncbi:DUF3179 domain-containing (seleno)protein [Segetibacter koreensis]|uniref:DUF3179 domain-containing (seleno)protein n=1 Tax=Segetibacter koreensis TaxID=398037 RepID=UPI0004782BB8|nr:DUF3179 domain-containing (seleno)protein [Segetibacter koreensis]